MSSQKDTVLRTVIVALVLCIVCSVIVAGSAVGLKDRQQKNKLLDRNKNILAAAGMYEAGKTDINAEFKKFAVKLVDLKTGQFLTEEKLSELNIDPAKYNQQKAAKDPNLSIKLSPEQDIAKIGRRANYAVVYLLMNGDAIETMVLPVHGYGLWGQLYGFLSLQGDANTVAGIGFYSHKETPGLGAEVDNPKWKAVWVGKKVFNSEGDFAIKSVRGGASGPHEFDALSGATLTTNGVDYLVEFWMGADGFGPFIKNLNAGGAQ